MRILLSATIVMTSFLTNLHAQEQGCPAGKWVSWQVSSDFSALVFSSIMLDAAKRLEDITSTNLSPGEKARSARCHAEVIRPKMSSNPIVHQELDESCQDQENYSRNSFTTCEVELMSGEVGNIYFDMRQTRIHRWGNQFFPKGYEFQQERAQIFFSSMKKVYERNMNNPVLKFRPRKVSSAFETYEFDEYVLLDGNLQEDGSIEQERQILSCAEEYYYQRGEERPLNPFRISCSFVYQFKFIPGSE